MLSLLSLVDPTLNDSCINMWLQAMENLVVWIFVDKFDDKELDHSPESVHRDAKDVQLLNQICNDFMTEN